MSGGKKITSYSLSPEAEGMIESVPNNIASIINTIVVIVLTLFHPESHEAGGAVQRELIKHKKTGEILGVRRTKIVCIPCIHDIMRRQQAARSSLLFKLQLPNPDMIKDYRNKVL